MLAALVLLPFIALALATWPIPTPWGCRALDRNIVSKFRRRAERAKRRAAS